MGGEEAVSEVIINSNLGEVKKELKDRVSIILEALGLEAQGNAIDEITSMKAVDTGRLRNSITWVTATGQGNPNQQGGEPAKPEDYKPNGTPEEGKVYIGTNVEYGPYIELGTHKMAARPFLKNAIINHQEQYKQKVKDGLR